MRKICQTYAQKYKTRVFRLTDIAAQDTLMKQKKADKLADASDALVSLAASFKKAQDGIRSMLGKEVEELSIERAHGDGLKAGVVSQVR